MNQRLKRKLKLKLLISFFTILQYISYWVNRISCKIWGYFLDRRNQCEKEYKRIELNEYYKIKP